MTYCVYVIRLRSDVLRKKRVAAANPTRVSHKPCVYVGSTFRTAEERYAQHVDPSAKVGSKIVREHHIALHKKLTAKQPTFSSRAEAEKHERYLAQRLRRKGYAVWSN